MLSSFPDFFPFTVQAILLLLEGRRRVEACDEEMRMFSAVRC